MRSATAAVATRALPARGRLIGRILVAIGIAVRQPIQSGGACAQSHKTNTYAAFALAEKPLRLEGQFRLGIRP